MPVNLCRIEASRRLISYHILCNDMPKEYIFIDVGFFLRNTEPVINSVVLCTFYINFTNFLMSAKPLGIFNNRYL